jgi:hypothetical protein
VSELGSSGLNRLADGQWSRAVGIALAALAVVYGGYSLGTALVGENKGRDFAQYYVAARLVLAGEPATMYDTGPRYQERAADFGVRGVPDDDGSILPVMNYAYPPLVAYASVPLALVPYRYARPLFALANFIAVFLGIWLLFANRPPESRRLLTMTGCVAAAVFYPTFFMVSNGQVGGILFFCCAAALHLARRDRWLLAGLVLGLATNIKLFPAILVPWFLLRREYRVVAAAAGWTLLLAAVPLALGGAGLYGVFIRQTLPAVYSGGAYFRNQGFDGFYSRLLTDNQYVRPLANNPGLARLLTMASGAAVLVATGVAVARKAARGSLGHDLQFAACLAASLLFLSKSYEHYALLLLPAFLFAFESLASRQQLRRWPLAGVAACYWTWAVVLSRESEYLKLPRSAWANPLYSVKFAATLVVWVILLALITGRRDPAATPGPPTPAGV